MLARKPSRRPGRYCIRLSRVFTSAVSWLMLCLVRFARPLEVRPHGLDRVELVGVRRKLADRQPWPDGDQFGHSAADVGIQVVPDHHQRPAELLVRGVQQPGVVRFGEALPPVVLAPAAGVRGRSAGAAVRA